jgi:hypothetical protein
MVLLFLLTHHLNHLSSFPGALYFGLPLIPAARSSFAAPGAFGLPVGPAPPAPAPAASPASASIGPISAMTAATSFISTTVL